ncbi:MAG: TolC family outer membrane protein [Porticoccaceae bacterium]
MKSAKHQTPAKPQQSANPLNQLARNLSFALFLALPVSGFSETLTEIYDLALNNDPQLRAANAAYLAGKESANIGRAGLLPQISASAEYSELDSEESSSSVFVLDGLEVNSGTRGDGDADQTSFGISIEQPLFNLPAWYDFKQGKTVSEQARLSFAAAQQELIIRVTDAYFNVLRASENLTSAIAEQQAIGRQLEQTRQRYEVGLLPITDVHEAQAAFDDASVNTLVLEGGLRVAFEGLEVLTGQPHSQLAGLAGSFPVLPPDASREEWVQLALANNLQLKISQQGRDAARENAEARKMEHLPTVTGAYSYADTDFDKEFSGQNLLGAPINTPSSSDDQTHVLSVRLNVPIFTGGLVSAQRRQAYQQYAEADETASYMLRNTTQQARTAHLNVITAAATVKALAQSIKSAESALEATRAGYEVGTRNIVDVLFAERNLHQAQRNYANARYTYISSSLNLKLVAGQLSPDDIYQLNAWVDPSKVIAPIIVQ